MYAFRETQAARDRGCKTMEHRAMNYLKRTCIAVVVAVVVMAASGCRREAINVNVEALNFGSDPYPLSLVVWNSSSKIDALDIVVEVSDPWIVVAPTQVRSVKPYVGNLDKKELSVEIDRSLLRRKGAHEGEIKLTARGAKPVSVKVAVYQETLLPSGGLQILNPVEVYSSPYLIEFAFSLRDSRGRTVVGEPNQFNVTAFEDDAQVGAERGLLMRRGAARQLWLELVLDYSIMMQNIDGAIAEMEYAATRVLLDSLNADALVGVSEFHRDDQAPKVVVPFNVDRSYTKSRISSIQNEYVRGFASGARMYDALLGAVRRFSQGSVGPADAKYIVLFSNGRDTSSSVWGEQVALEAVRRGVRIIAVGFGEAVDSAALMSLASVSGGWYVPAASVEELQRAFQRIVEDLNGQYIMRWASLRRDSKWMRPSFNIVYGTTSASHKAKNSFRATEHAGNVLEGRLVLVQSDAPNRTTVFLRANYVPRGITQFRCYVNSPESFNVSAVSVVDDGLMDSWSISQEKVEDDYMITATSPGTPIAFAEFGPMLRFEFNQAVDDPFTRFEIDNDIYTENQTFKLE